MRPGQRYLPPIQADVLRIACRVYSHLLSFLQRTSALYLAMQRACQLKWPRRIVREIAALIFPSTFHAQG